MPETATEAGPMWCSCRDIAAVTQCWRAEAVSQTQCPAFPLSNVVYCLSTFVTTFPTPGNDLGPTVLQGNPIKDVARAPRQMKATNSLSSRVAAYTQGVKRMFSLQPCSLPPSLTIRTCCTSEETRLWGLCVPQMIFLPYSGKNRGGRWFQSLKTFWWCSEGRQAAVERNLYRLSGIYNVYGPLWLQLLLFLLLDLRAYLSRSEYQRNSERQWGKE